MPYHLPHSFRKTISHSACYCKKSLGVKVFSKQLTLVALTAYCLFSGPISADTQGWQAKYQKLQSEYKAHNWKSAIEAGLEAYAATKKELGEQDTTVALILHRIGASYWQLADTAAVSYYLRAIDIWESDSNYQKLSYAKTLSNLGNVYGSQAHFETAERILLRSLELKRKFAGDWAYTTSATLNNLGLMHMTSGDYVKAEEAFEDCKEIRERILGPMHPRLSSIYGNLSSLNYLMGRLSKSLHYFDISQNIRKAIGDTTGTDYANLLMNKAVALTASERYDEALDELNLAVEKFILSSPNDSSKAALLFNNIARVYKKRHSYSEAVKYFDIAKRLAQQANEGGGENNKVAMIGLNLAEAMLLNNELDHARTLLDSLTSSLPIAFGATHPETARLLYAKGELASSTRNHDKALELFLQAAEIYRLTFQRTSVALSELDILSFTSSLNNVVDRALVEFFLVDNSDSMVNKVAAVFVQTKGLSLDATLARARNRRQSENGIVHSPTTVIGEDGNKGSSATLPDISDLYRPITLSDFADVLRQDQALVTYYHTSPFYLKNEAMTEQLIALIVKSDQRVQLVDCGPAEMIDSLIDLYRFHLNSLSKTSSIPTKNDYLRYREISASLSNLIWRPLQKHFGPTDEIIVSPDGQLNLISFAGLLEDDSTFLIDNHELKYVPVARDLLWNISGGRKKVNSGLLALGNPDFFATYESRRHSVDNAIAIGETDVNLGSALTLRGAVDCIDLDSALFTELPGAAQELVGIQKSWSKLVTEPVEVFIGESASETSFRYSAPSARIIHLATHGYFLSENCLSELQKKTLTSNPLLFSGLALAGANRHRSDADSLGLEDGYLSAEEISELNLAGVEVVTLSACETGLGSYRSGGGLYGLRRAFKIAGVNTVISALWSVNDEITAETMKNIYLENGVSPAQNLRSAQLKLKSRLIKAGIPPHPYLWAAFVSEGN